MRLVLMSFACLVGCLLAFNDQLSSALPKKGDYFVLLNSRPKGGMFSIFDDVLDLLQRHEMGFYQGVEIDFAQTGLYYQPNYGKNWWSYYYNPIHLGTSQAPQKRAFGGPPYITHWHHDPIPKVKKAAFRLIQKYFHLKSHMQKKIDTLKAMFKDHFVISVHFRGTDKHKEAPTVPYKKFIQAVQTVMKTYGTRNYKIFIATDEQAFLEYMIKIFGKRVFYNKDAIRSCNGRPVHFDPRYNHYKCGEDALIDAILLSHGNYLIKSCSNLSRWSIFFNPDIPYVQLNDSYRKKTRFEMQLWPLLFNNLISISHQ